MEEKLGEIGDVLRGIRKAVRTMRLLKADKTKLFKVIELTKKHANDLEKLNIPDEPLLKELKLELEEVKNSASKLEVWLEKFEKECEVFERFVATKLKGSVPPEVVREFCEILTSTHRMASDFSAAFDDFIGLLLKAQQLATKLTDKLKQKAAELEKEAAELDKEAAKLDEEANRKKKWGAAKTGGLAIGGIGLVALGFFTGGAAWIAAGTVAGLACGVQAACAVKTVAEITEEAKEKVLNVKAMRELAGGFSVNSSKLEVIAKDLKSSSDEAGTIQLDKKVTEALQTVLEFYRKDVEKDERIALQQEQLDEKDARIAEMEAKLKRFGIKSTEY